MNIESIDQIFCFRYVDIVNFLRPYALPYDLVSIEDRFLRYAIKTDDNFDKKKIPNCRNCGAPVIKEICEYCTTKHY